MKNYQFDAMWISKEGDSFAVNEHAVFIQQNPEIFGLDQKLVLNLLIDELKSIALKLINQGWIRYRYMDGVYRFQVSRLTKQVKEIIRKVLMDNNAYDIESIRIFTQTKQYEGDVQSILDSKGLREISSPAIDDWRFV